MATRASLVQRPLGKDEVSAMKDLAQEELDALFAEQQQQQQDGEPHGVQQDSSHAAGGPATSAARAKAAPGGPMKLAPNAATELTHLAMLMVEEGVMRAALEAQKNEKETARNERGELILDAEALRDILPQLLLDFS